MELSFEFGIPKGELKKRMSMREFAEYKAFAMFHPFGDFRRDLQVARAIVEIRYALTGNNNAKVGDFIPDFEEAFRKVHLKEAETETEREQNLFHTLAKRRVRR